MKYFLLIAVLAAACKPSKPVVAAVPPAAEPNAAEKYAGGLATDVKLAQEAKAKAEAANKRTDDSQKALQQAEGQ